MWKNYGRRISLIKNYKYAAIVMETNLNHEKNYCQGTFTYYVITKGGEGSGNAQDMITPLYFYIEK